MDLPGFNIPKDTTVRPDVGQIALREEVSYEEKMPNGKAKSLDRRTMQHGYLQAVSMMNVVIAPFHESIFSNETFNLYLNSCREWLIKKCSETHQSAVLLNFRTVTEGDQAWRDLRNTFTDSPHVQVFQPRSSTEIELFGNHINTSSEWVLNECYFGVREFQENFRDRLILLENVPQCTEAELRVNFPEALNIIDFSHDPDSPGMVVIEVYDRDQGVEFIKKYMTHQVKGQRILVDWYMTREKRHGHLMKRWKEIKKRKGFEPLSDPDRLEVVRKYHQLRDLREKVILRHDLAGLEKLKEIGRFKTQIQELQDHIYADAKRRYAEGIPVCEPESDQLMLVKRVMSGEMDQARAVNQMITKQDLERQAKEREVERLKQNMSLSELSSLNMRFPGSKRPAGGAMALPGLPPSKRFMTGRRGARGAGMMGGRGKSGYAVPNKANRGRGGAAQKYNAGANKAGAGEGGQILAAQNNAAAVKRDTNQSGAKQPRGGGRGGGNRGRGGNRGGNRGGRGGGRGGRGGGRGRGGSFGPTDGFKPKGNGPMGMLGGGDFEPMGPPSGNLGFGPVGRGRGRGRGGFAGNFNFPDWNYGGTINTTDHYGGAW